MDTRVSNILAVDLMAFENNVITRGAWSRATSSSLHMGTTFCLLIGYFVFAYTFSRQIHKTYQIIFKIILRIQQLRSIIASAMISTPVCNLIGSFRRASLMSRRRILNLFLITALPLVPSAASEQIVWH